MKKHLPVEKQLSIILMLIFCLLITPSCDNNSTEIQQEGQTEKESKESKKDFGSDGKSFYQPKEFAAMDFTDENSRWCFQRSSQSENFIVFWEQGFGENPNGQEIPENMRVNIDSLLTKAEDYYKTNTEELEFIYKGENGSWTDAYKMEIYLLYQEEWLATGAGYDNIIGALWINPSTCQPAGSTIAHEIGHCFQYQIYCDQLKNGRADNQKSGFRYGYENSNGGNGFWEQCAQWQAYQNYKAEFFTYYDMPAWFDNCHRAFEHEWMRYQSYWLQEYIAGKHGASAIAKIWQESIYPEDALQAYMRLYMDNDQEQLKAEMYNYAVHMATFDIDSIRRYSAKWQGQYKTTWYNKEDGFSQIAYADCPGQFGFNVVECEIPADGVVTVDFKGLPNGSDLNDLDAGTAYKGGDKDQAVKVGSYNSSDETACWRYGFVALQEDGTRMYGDMYSDNEKTISFNVPADTKSLYMVVMGASEEYKPHPWNDDELDDLQFPYELRFNK